MLPPHKLPLPIIPLSICVLLLSIPAFGRRVVGTRASSSYGTAGDQAFWELLSPSQSNVNGITVSEEAVCPGGVDKSVSPAICSADYVFLYQISSGPSNLVVTFAGLSKFAFSSSGFGVLLCDPSAANNMLCTQNLTAQDVDGLNIGWDALGGDLVLTIPSVPAGVTLTIFIDEGAQSLGPLVSPMINLGGLVVIPPSMSFGSQESGTASPPQTVTILNSADFSSTITVSGVSNNSNFVSADACVALGRGESCALFLSFAPTVPGDLSDTLNLTDDSPLSTQAIGLHGVGNLSGVTLSPSTAMFGSQPVGASSVPTAVVISNAPRNPQALAISGIVASANPVTGQPDFAETDNCNTSIAPGSSCQLQIIFTPTISGLIRSSITVTDNSPDGSHTLQLSGNGTEQNSATIAPSSLNFGNQASGTTSTPQTVTVTNSSSTDLTVVAVNATAGFGIGSDRCSNAGPLGARANCTVSVAFQPGEANSYSGTLTIANDASGGTLVIPLTGAGVDFTLSSSSDSDTVNQGGSATYSLTIVSQGGFTGTIQLTCSGAPSETTCTPSPNSVSLDGSSPVKSTISVKTTAPSAAMSVRSWGQGSPPILGSALLALACVWLGLALYGKRTALRFLPACILFTLIVPILACGGGTNNGHRDPGTPKGSYPLTVSAVGGGLTHSVNLTLVVQ